MSNCMPDGVAAWNEPATERRDTNNNDALATVGMASAAPLQFQDPSPSSYSDPVLFTKTATEEYVTNALLKFLMCNQFSSVGPDILQDPYFREYMERAQKHGVPSSLLRGCSLVIEKSLLNIKQEVHQYMLMVQESWNITGCTMMAFHLNHQYKGKVFTLEQDRYVYGFYCPKGFIFVEAPYCSGIEDTAFKNALEQHSPSFSIYHIKWQAIFLHHSINHGLGDDHLCELSDKKLPQCVESLPCLRHEIQGLCINTCKSSEWAQSLINKAVKIHECLLDFDWTLDRWYHKLIMEKDEDFKNIEYINGKDASRLSNFLSNFISFMLLERKLKEKLSYEMQFREDYMWDRAELEAILKDSKFWGDGRHLLQVLTLTLRIPDLMDTLVPTAGYLSMAIDEVNDNLTGEDGPIDEEGEAFTFWKDLESKLRGTIEGRGVAASYLNPFYLREQDVKKETQLQNKVKLELTERKSTHYDLRGKEEKVHEELQKYGNYPLKKEFIHPVKWWEKYGNDLPLLRKLAIRLLSQPLNCMCNQVKKHMYQLQGADDFILRLNVRMMEEFKVLGDDIYKPINLYKLMLDDWLTE